ncbi:MAG: hypothetical protein ACLSAF_17065 [Intestinimonas sp.]
MGPSDGRVAVSTSFPKDSGSLREGNRFGNLILAALGGISHSFDQAVAQDEARCWPSPDRVLPVANEDVRLEAHI